MVLLVGESLERQVGRNLQWQCTGLKSLNTVCESQGRAEQMIPEIEKRDSKKDKAFVQVGTNNLRMDETDEMMTKYGQMIQRLKEKKQREFVVTGILPSFRR